MDFGFTEEQENLRKEFHDFYIDELPEDFESGRSAMTKKTQTFWLDMQKKAGSKGYLTPGWPKEYGGLGLTSIEQGIVNEEEGRIGVWWPTLVSYLLAGPAIILFGTEEQKKRFIPPIVRGEEVWFQCFTEPDAGSDEANVQARAMPDGNDFILNGQKVFVGEAYKPDWLYTLVRTADAKPKHRGLSLFLIPANLPGITYRPLAVLGDYYKNEIFFDDVKLSRQYLVGELNRGFYHAMATFEYERSGTGFSARFQRGLEEFVQFCKETERDGKPLIEDPQVRDALAQTAVEAEVFRLESWNTVWWFGERKRLGPKPYDLTSYFSKMFPTLFAKRAMDIMGLYGQLRPGSKWAGLGEDIELQWESTRSAHGGGTPEIQKVVLAQRGLGLPRIPAQIMAEIGKAVKEAER